MESEWEISKDADSESLNNFLTFSCFDAMLVFFMKYSTLFKLALTTQ